MAAIGCDKWDVDCLINTDATTLNNAYYTLYEEMGPCAFSDAVGMTVDGISLPLDLTRMQDFP